MIRFSRTLPLFVALSAMALGCAPASPSGEASEQARAPDAPLDDFTPAGVETRPAIRAPRPDARPSATERRAGKWPPPPPPRCANCYQRGA